jgi:phospholipid/cholesterol/gamma-HCH transport system substrate-binding protein
VKHSKEIRTGLIALSILVATVWGYNFLKGNDIFSRQKIYYTTYAQVDGLAPSSAVFVSGYKVGFVRNIDFHPTRQGEFLVEMVITASKFTMPDSASAQLVSTDLLGSKGINLIVKSGMPEAPEYDTIPGFIEEGLAETIGTLGKSIMPLKVKAENMIVTLDSTLNDLRNLLGPANRQGPLNLALNDLASTMSNFKQVSANLNDVLKNDGKVNRILSDVEAFTGVLDKNKGELDNLLKNLSALSDTLTEARIAQTVQQANATLTETTELFKKINSGEGTIGKLVNDETIYTNLEKATADLDSLFVDIKANPNRYVHVSVFGRKEKKEKK